MVKLNQILYTLIRLLSSHLQKSKSVLSIRLTFIIPNGNSYREGIYAGLQTGYEGLKKRISRSQGLRS